MASALPSQHSLPRPRFTRRVASTNHVCAPFARRKLTHLRPERFWSHVRVPQPSVFVAPPAATFGALPPLCACHRQYRQHLRPCPVPAPSAPDWYVWRYSSMCAFVPSTSFLLTRRSQLSSASPLRRARRSSVCVPPARLHRAPRCAAEPFSDGQAPSGAVLCGALEISFRNVWLRLMTSGVGPEYTHAIRAFVLAAAASYKAGYSLTALRFELASHEKEATFMGRDVRLNDDEKKTRFIWLTLVYLTLKRCQFPTEKEATFDIAADIETSNIRELMPGLAAFVNNVYDAAQRGLDLQRYKLELNLRKDDKSPPLDKGQVSIRSQWARIVFSTLELMPGSGLKR